MFRVFRSAWYEKKLQKLSSSEQKRIQRFEQQLKRQPFAGKPLGYEFFREKKFNGNRLLFLVYEERQVIFLVTITNKKAQQHEIDVIKANLDVYQKELGEKLDQL